MSIEAIKGQLQTIPEVASWPEIAALLDKKIGRKSYNCWDYPGIGATAVGGSADQALCGATAIFCTLLSIHFVDDLLDEDPRGLHHELGVGKVANIALALQATATKVLTYDPYPERQPALQRSLANMSLATCKGQHLDAEGLPGEERYWQVIRLKTPPLFGCALELGALLGGGSEEQAAALGSLGLPIGEMVQINDDLNDALEVPARPDWHREAGNLPILYARLAPHAGRDRFEELRSQVQDEDALREAQNLLIESGAVSYCAYCLVESYKKAKRILSELSVADPTPLAELVDSHIAPLLALLRSLGIKEPEGLLSV